MQSSSPATRNRFSLGEWSGAFGDLGTLLPIAFALVVCNGFTPGRLFLLWGLVYIATGVVFRVPVAVQPLKAMAVIAISAGLDTAMLADAAFWYGALLVLLASTGLIRRLQYLFSVGLIRGVQLGVGLLLAQKAMELALQKGIFLHAPQLPPLVAMATMAGFTLILALSMRSGMLFVLPLLLASGVTAGFIMAPPVDVAHAALPDVSLHLPALALLGNCVTVLIIPQLPLTLGNAVYAASDTCHTLWDRQACRVSAPRLAFSIGFSNIVIGLAGGFPICHGAGGIGAHGQFGGKTGGATMIIGVLLVTAALVPSLAGLIFLIPVPLLSGMLLFDAWRMMKLIELLIDPSSIIVAVTVGAMSFFTHNLAMALLAGFCLEKTLQAFAYARPSFSD